MRLFIKKPIYYSKKNKKNGATKTSFSMTRKNIFDTIVFENIQMHNIKGATVAIPKGKLTVLTGVSGSGKTSIAFDTIYAEGQIRYLESVDTDIRAQLAPSERPNIEKVSGITPTIAIEQKTINKNPRSTVGTLTEIYDYLRLTFSKCATFYCPISHEAISPQSQEKIIQLIQKSTVFKNILILCPIAKNKKGSLKPELEFLLRKGFTRVRMNGTIMHIEECQDTLSPKNQTLDLILDKLSIEEKTHNRIAQAVLQGLEISQDTIIVHDLDKKLDHLYTTIGYSPKSQKSYPPLEPQDFSFNNPKGMCDKCQGLGYVKTLNLEKSIDPEKSIADDCCILARSYQTKMHRAIYDTLAATMGFDIHTPWKKLPKKGKEAFLHGLDKHWIWIPLLKDRVYWKGVLNDIQKRYEEAKTDAYRKEVDSWMIVEKCPSCLGSRLKAYPSAAQLHNKTIHEICQLSISECLHFFSDIHKKLPLSSLQKDLIQEIAQRLAFLIDAGLAYLTLDRPTPTLSGGEAQRTRLASLVRTGLVDVTYILDEPTIGLHPEDNEKLISIIHKLKNQGNTVIVVEHDEDMILSADHIIDVGPLSGKQGGKIVATGNLADLAKSKNSITADYLYGKKAIHIPTQRKKIGLEAIVMEKVFHHNLKNITVSFPLNVLCVVTGVSGSGKSSLITETLYPHLHAELNGAEKTKVACRKITIPEALKKVVCVNQDPIGKTPRSNPATYIKIFDEIRSLFAQLPESKSRGYLPGRFSFNVKEGSCPKCEGMGQVEINMDFLESIWITCDLCQGKRFDTATLEITYKDKNIHDILAMSIYEAMEFFKEIPSIYKKLVFLQEVGLGYLELGQSSTTLSGGEAQRIKLAKELTKSAYEHTLYILDEPTTGLHWHDVEKLIHLLHRLVVSGHSVLVIEHHLDLIKNADWIIDLGLKGGEDGGSIVGTGTPEKIAKLNTPTGKAISQALCETLSQKTAQKIQRKKTSSSFQTSYIQVKSCCQNNLKYVDAHIPLHQMTLCTGPSGAGKTSFAIETVYAEGQRRFIDSMSSYARQFVKKMPKPQVEEITHLSPSICIESTFPTANPRSTVGTLTEVYDYLRILFSKIGKPYCPITKQPIIHITKEYIASYIIDHFLDKTITLATYVDPQNKTHLGLIQQGFNRKYENHSISTIESIEELSEVPLEIVLDRVQIKSKAKNRIFKAIELTQKFQTNGLILYFQEKKEFFTYGYTAKNSPKTYPKITPQLFAFNKPEGMCLECRGLGLQFCLSLSPKDLHLLTVQDLLIKLWGEKAYFDTFYLIEKIFHKKHISMEKSLSSLSTQDYDFLFQGSDHVFIIENNLSVQWVGINATLSKAAKSAHYEIKEEINKNLGTYTCPSCLGTRLNTFARSIFIQEHSIADLSQSTLTELKKFIQNLKMSSQERSVLQEVIAQIISRLDFLDDVGVGYLSLHRMASSLSRGENQRIRLAKSLGGTLNGILYVLDEPSSGLHAEDIEKLTNTLQEIKRKNNTLLIVDHNKRLMEQADLILDFGPGSGPHGGQIVAQGTYTQILKNPLSITASSLLEVNLIPEKRELVTSKNSISIRNASLHNLKNISVAIPTQAVTAITGVSGSGKSTLMLEILSKAFLHRLAHEDTCNLEYAQVSGLHLFSRVVVLKQEPLIFTNRSDVGSYVDVLSLIRKIYAALPEAKAQGLSTSHFTPNHRKGMCQSCWGLGYKKIDMMFLPPITSVCTECNGLKLNSRSLKIKYKNYTFGDIFKMNIEEAIKLLDAFSSIVHILSSLCQLGLSYLQLGQPMQTLSQGEIQRLKLANNLYKKWKKPCLFLIDELSSGLHLSEIKPIIKTLIDLKEQKHTVVLIEHSLPIIAQCDHVIDLGPGAGQLGGHLIASTTPGQLIHIPESMTGKHLKKQMQK